MRRLLVSQEDSRGEAFNVSGDLLDDSGRIPTIFIGQGLI